MISCNCFFALRYACLQCTEWVRQAHKVNELALRICVLQTDFTEQVMPNKVRVGCTQPTIGIYSIHTRYKEVYLNMDTRIYFILFYFF